MPMREYCDFTLIADTLDPNNESNRAFTVQVFTSPVGEGSSIQRSISNELQQYLVQQEERELDMDGIIQLGELLGDLLLPTPVRELFYRSLDKLKPEQGLRLRLRLAPALADIPWEYLHIQRDSEGKDATGFLVLDPRISVVRHE